MIHQHASLFRCTWIRALIVTLSEQFLYSALECCKMTVTQLERCATALLTVSSVGKQKDIVEPAGAAHCCATFQHLGQLLQHCASPEYPIEGAPLTL